MSNTDKIFKFDGKYYSNTDHSEEVEDDKWGGDLYDLYYDASHSKEYRGVLCETTYYYSAYNPENAYEDSDELMADFFEDDEVSLEQMRGE